MESPFNDRSVFVALSLANKYLLDVSDLLPSDATTLVFEQASFAVNPPALNSRQPVMGTITSR